MFVHYCVCIPSYFGHIYFLLLLGRDIGKDEQAKTIRVNNNIFCFIFH